MSRGRKKKGKHSAGKQGNSKHAKPSPTPETKPPVSLPPALSSSDLSDVGHSNRQSRLSKCIEDITIASIKGGKAKKYTFSFKVVIPWIAFAAAVLNLVSVIYNSTKLPEDGVLSYPAEQITLAVTLLVALATSAAALIDYVEDKAKTARLDSAERSAAQIEEEIRETLYQTWVEDAYSLDGVLCMYYRAIQEDSFPDREAAIREALSSIHNIFNNCGIEADVLSVCLLIPIPSGLQVVARVPEGGGVSKGRIIQEGVNTRWGAMRAFTCNALSYTPDIHTVTAKTERKNARYRSVLSIPIRDGQDQKVVAVINLDSAAPEAFGVVKDDLDARVVLAHSVALPLMRLIALILINRGVYGNVRTPEESRA